MSTQQAMAALRDLAARTGGPVLNPGDYVRAYPDGPGADRRARMNAVDDMLGFGISIDEDDVAIYRFGPDEALGLTEPIVVALWCRP